MPSLKELAEIAAEKQKGNVIDKTEVGGVAALRDAARQALGYKSSTINGKEVKYSVPQAVKTFGADTAQKAVQQTVTNEINRVTAPVKNAQAAYKKYLPGSSTVPEFKTAADYDELIAEYDRRIEEKKSKGVTGNKFLDNILKGFAVSSDTQQGNQNAINTFMQNSGKNIADEDEVQQLQRERAAFKAARDNTFTSNLIDKIQKNKDDVLFEELYKLYSDKAYKNVSGAADSADYAAENVLETNARIREIETQLKNKGYTDEEIKTYDNYRDDQAKYDLQNDINNFVGDKPILNGALLTGLSVATAPARGISYIADKISGGKGYTGGSDVQAFSQATQAAVGKQIDEHVGGKKGKALKFAYNVAVSSAESAIGRVAAGGVSVYLMGLNAAASTYDEALNRGLDKGNAAATAITAGIFEALFEHVAWDKISMLSSDGLKKVPAMIKDFLVAAGTEGSEEVLTDLANELWDYLTNGGLSEYETARASGMTPAEYAKQFGMDLLESFAAGAASGGLSYAAMSGKNYTTNKAITAARNAATGNLINARGNADAIIQQAESIENADEAITESAEKVKKKLSKTPKTKIGAAVHNVSLNVSTGQLYDNVTKSVVKDALTSKVADIKEIPKKQKADFVEAVVDLYGGKRLDSPAANLVTTKYKNESGEEVTVLEELEKGDAKWVQDLSDKLSVQRAAAVRGTEGAAEAQSDIKLRKKNVVESVNKDGGRSLVEGFDADYDNGTNAKIGAIAAKTDNGISVFVDDNGGDAFEQVVAEYSVDNADNKIAVTDEDVKALYQYAEDQIHNRITDDNLEAFGTAFQLNTGVEMSIPAANVEIGIYDPAINKNVNAYCQWFYDAYKAGKSGISFSKYMAIYKDADYEGEISGEQLAQAFRQGARDHEFKPGVTRIGVKKMSDNDKKIAAALHEEFKAHGLSLVIVDSIDYARKNGYYFEGGNTVVVALDAEQGLFSTAAYHELFHVLEEIDSEAAKELTDTIIELLKSKMGDERYNEIYQQRLDVYNGNANIVESEIAAQYIGTLASADIDTVAKEMQKQPGLWQKIVDTFKDIIESIKSKLQILAIQDKTVRAALDTQIEDAEKVLKMFSEALDKALQPYDEQTDVAGISIETNSAAPVIDSLKTWTESDYVRERDKTKKLLMEKLDLSARTVNKYLKDIDSIAKMVADDRMRLDYDAAPGRSSFVSNSEYGESLDFNTLCAKRRLLTGTFTAIQNYFENTALTPKEILDLRNMMKSKGYEVNCGLCYVEGSRAKMGVFAQEFIKRYKKHNPDAEFIPTLAQVNTPDGIESIRVNHPEVYLQYEKFWNNKGKIGEGDTNLFSSQAKPKLYQSRTDYKHEILKMYADKEKVRVKNLNGGMRIQSFSDFELVHMLDMMQVIMDMSRVGLGGQAYTKVPEFAWAFGGTGLKINLSLIAKGVDENGKLIFDDVEGMPHNTAFDIRNAYSDNVGTILVVFDDAQLYAAMADDRVDFIIPFHRSQWTKAQYNDLGLPTTTKDFTYIQNERYTVPHYHEYQGRQVKEKAANYMPNTYWDFSKSGKQNAEKYLEMCYEDGRRPKFYKLLDRGADGRYHLKADGSTDGYWKLLIDFKMYNNAGKGVPQVPVKPSFNMGNSKNELLNEHSITNMLNEYTGGHSSYPVAQDIVDEFIKKKEGKLKESRKITEQQNEEYMNAVSNKKYTIASMMVRDAAKAAGFIPVKRYHQTGQKFNRFNNSNPVAGANDSETPNGYFFKANDHDIGVGGDYVNTGKGGNIQMGVYLSADNMLKFANRKEARQWYRDNVPGYKDIDDKLVDISNRADAIADENTDEMFAELDRYEEEGTLTEELEKQINDKYDKLWDDKIKDIVEEENDIRKNLRNILDNYFLNNNSQYDGIELVDDGHRYIDGKRENVHTFIVFNPSQIKSADPVVYDDNGDIVPLSERFNKENEDIRYSKKLDNATQEKIDKLNAENKGLREMNNALKGFVSHLQNMIAKERLEKDPNKAFVPSRAALLKMASKYNDRSSRYTNEEFADLLQGIFWNAASTGNLDTDRVIQGIYNLVDNVIDSSYTKEVNNEEEYKEIKGEFLRKRFAVSKEVYDFLLEEYSGQKGLNAALRGRFTLRVQGTEADLTPFDGSFAEMAEAYPHLLDPETDVYHQVQEVLAAFEASKPVVHDMKDVLGFGTKGAAVEYEKFVLAQANDIFAELAKALPAVNRITELEQELAVTKQKTQAEKQALNNVMKLDRELQAAKEELKKEQKRFNDIFAAVGGDAQADAVRQINDYYQDKIKDAVEYQQGKFEREQKIKNITRTVRRINAKLESNSKNKRIIDEMKPLIAPFVRVFVEEKQYGDEITGNATFSQREVERLVKFYAELQRGIFSRALNSDENTDAAAGNPYERFYTEQVLENLHELQDTLADRSIRSLTVEELRKVNEIVDNFSKMITESEEIFVNGKKVKIVDSARRFAKEASQFKGKKIEGPIMKAVYRQFTPIYFFKELLGEEMGKYYDDMRNAQDDWVRKIDTAITRFDDIKNRYHYDKWKDDEIEHTFSTGFKHTFTTETILQIYATAKRESTVKEDTQHLFKGGIVFSEDFLAEKKKREKANKKKSKKDNSEEIDNYDETTWLDNISRGEVKEILAGLAVPMSLDDYQSLIGSLTAEQKAYADSIVEFMSTEVGAWGNKATSELYGIDIFNEKYYFPFKVDDSYRNSGSVMSGDPSILARGFTKRLTYKANPPLMLSSFTEVAANHVQDMAQYSAFAIPVSNMQSLYYASIPRYEEDESGLMDPIGIPVKGILKAVFGEGAEKYMHKFLQDVNGGIKPDSAERAYNKMFSMFKRSAVLGNLQVVVQQPTAIMRAMAILPPQDFLGKASGKDFKEMMKYSEVAKLKSWGGFDIGSSGSATSWIINEKETIDKIADVLGKGAEFADAVTWTNMWNACKRNIKRTTDIEVGSDEYFEAVKNLFRDVCDYTQVYDSTLTRNEWMRSKSAMIKTLTAFGAEPSVSFNLLFASTNNRNINHKRAIVAYVFNVLVNELFKSITQTIRKKDNDRNFFEQYISNFLGNLVGTKKLAFLDGAWNPASLIFMVKDILSVIEGWSVERPDMSVISDIVNAVNKFVKKGIKNAGLDDYISLVGAISSATPIPLNAILRDGFGIANLIFSKNDSKFTADALKYSLRAEIWDGTKESDVYKAYHSVVNNETETIRRMSKYTEAEVRAYMQKGYDRTEAEKHAAADAEKRYHNKIVEGIIAVDKDASKAADALNDGNLTQYENYVELLKKKGFTQNDVIAAVNKLYNAMQPEDLTEVKETQDKLLYTNEQLKKAYSEGNVNNFKHVADYLMQNGKTQTAINSTVSEMIWDKFDEGQISLSDVRKEFKTYTDLDDEKIDDRLKTKIMNMYKDGKITDDKAADYLVKYANEESDNARNALDFYEWQAKDNNAEKYPDVTKSNYKSYVKYDYASIGVDFNSYLDIREKYNSFHGETKQADIAAYINTLPYSRSVKEQLFLKMGGYSSKALKKYSFK